jgi:hypothetical protein
MKERLGAWGEDGCGGEGCTVGEDDVDPLDPGLALERLARLGEAEVHRRAADRGELVNCLEDAVFLAGQRGLHR